MKFHELEKYLILFGQRGSKAHGTALPNNSDTDLIGITVMPLRFYTGLFSFASQEFNHQVIHEDIVADIVIHGIRKFMGMLIKQNPNAIEAVFTPAENWQVVTTSGKMLLEAAPLLVSKKAYKAYRGFAESQLKRLEVCEEAAGDKRRELFEKHGYVPKQAAHCIRLLRQGSELLSGGQLTVDRSGLDAEELKAIKRGEWTIEAITKQAAVELECLDDALEGSYLPDQVDFDFASNLCQDIVQKTHSERFASKIYL